MFLDTRLGNTPRWFMGRPKDWGMRVPDEILKCVVFLGRDEYAHGRQFFKFGGTGFLVGIPTKEIPDGHFHYLVTAKHTAEVLAERSFGMRVNTTDGYATTAMSAPEVRWWFHPTEEKSVDVAVTPWFITEEEDVLWIPTSMFLTDEVVHETYIGPGDEVFITGLFSKLHGRARNCPIVRTGNVAMMPTDAIPGAQIGEWRGEIKAYLIEARSIGGLSGSPVFVMVKTRTLLRQKQMQSVGEFYLMGLMHGHWDLRPEDRNKDWIVTDNERTDRINLGIAVVVPAKKILEVLDHSELIETRAKTEEEELKRRGSTEPDHAFSGDRKRKNTRRRKA